MHGSRGICIVLGFLLLSMAAHAQNTAVDRYISNCPVLRIAPQSTLDSLAMAAGILRERDSTDRDSLSVYDTRILVRTSDFCYTIEIGDVTYRIAENSSGDLIGIAQTEARIIKDHYYDDTGAITPVWIHVDVPGYLHYVDQAQPGLDALIGMQVLVMGEYVDGTTLVLPGFVFSCLNDGRLVESRGADMDQELLWNLIKRRRELSRLEHNRATAPVVVEGVATGSLDDFRTTGVMKFSVSNILKGDTPATIDVEYPGDVGSIWGRPTLVSGARYLLALMPVGNGRFTCPTEKLGTYPIVNGEIHGTSRAAVSK